MLQGIRLADPKCRESYFGKNTFNAFSTFENSQIPQQSGSNAFENESKPNKKIPQIEGIEGIEGKNTKPASTKREVAI